MNERARLYYSAAFAASLLVMLTTAWLTSLLARQKRALEELERVQEDLRRSEANFRAVVDSANQGIITYDRDLRVMTANPAAERILGLSGAELAGSQGFTSLLTCVNEDGSPSLLEQRPIHVTRRTGHPVNGRITGIRRPGGPTQWLSVNTGILRQKDGGDWFGVVSSISDVTALKRAERMKDEFISTVSHELRTPLTSISGSLALVAGGVTGALPAAASKLVDIAADNCLRLIHLVNDLLDVERMASGNLSLQLQVSDLGPLLLAAVRANEGFASQHGVTLRLDASPDALPANVDGGRLNQAVTNLISNAVKFSPRAGVVEIFLRRLGDRARINVRDSGPGIPLEFRGRIFQKFSQADGSDARRTSGSGLGLSIARGLVERMGGTIGYDTVLGKGTTFFIEIALADAGAPCAASASHNLEA